jgi:hypothetical protein
MLNCSQRFELRLNKVYLEKDFVPDSVLFQEDMFQCNLLLSQTRYLIS